MARAQVHSTGNGGKKEESLRGIKKAERRNRVVDRNSEVRNCKVIIIRVYFSSLNLLGTINYGTILAFLEHANSASTS